MADDVRWLTYDELSVELGIARESARQLAIRKRWSRRKGNDGKARIGVPEDELQARTADATPSAPSDAPSHELSDDTGHPPSVLQVLTRHISRLETELEAVKQERDGERSRLQSEIEVLRQERDAERLRAAQIDVLNALVEVGRNRINDISAHRDTISSQVDKLNDLIGIERKRAEADRNHLRADLDRLQAELDRSAERLALVAPAPAAPAAQSQGWWPFRRRA